MICPHCQKPITKGVTPELRRKILSLRKSGHSLRDIEAVINRQVSFSTIARVVNKKEDK